MACPDESRPDMKSVAEHQTQTAPRHAAVVLSPVQSSDAGSAREYGVLHIEFELA